MSKLFISKVFSWSVLFDITCVSTTATTGKTETFTVAAVLVSQLPHRKSSVLSVVPHSTRNISWFIHCVPLASSLSLCREM